MSRIQHNFKVSLHMQSIDNKGIVTTPFSIVFHTYNKSIEKHFILQDETKDHFVVVDSSSNKEYFIDK